MNNKQLNTLCKIIECNSRITKKLEHSLGAVHGLGLNEYFALHHLNLSEGAVSRISLAETLGLSASGVTRLLNPMEKLGLVERQVNERDARLSLVKISKTGKTKLKDASKSAENAASLLLTNTSSDEQNTLLSIINKVI